MARGQVRGAERVGVFDHRVEPHVPVAVHARVRGLPLRVPAQERVDDARPELLAQVEREVRHAHPVRDRAGDAHRVRRAAGRFRVVGGIRPQLQRDRHRVAPGAVDEQCGDGRVDAAAHGDQRALRRGRQRRARAHGRAERPVQRVGGEVGGVQLAGREAAEFGRDLARADARGVEHALAVDEQHGGRARRGQGAAALGVEAGRGDAVAVDPHRHADQVAAGGAAGAPVGGAGNGPTAPHGRGQVLLEALAVHERRF
jgi:hypothetical protein